MTQAAGFKVFITQDSGFKVFMIDWLIDYLRFTFRSRIFHLYGDVSIASGGLQNLGLSSALRAFEHGGIFIVPHLLWHGASVSPVQSKGPPPLIAFYGTLVCIGIVTQTISLYRDCVTEHQSV
jgi:hypothetical protein